MSRAVQGVKGDDAVHDGVVGRTDSYVEALDVPFKVDERGPDVVLVLFFGLVFGGERSDVELGVELGVLACRGGGSRSPLLVVLCFTVLLMVVVGR